MSKKTKHNDFNPVVIQRLLDKYKVSRRFILFSISGERTSERATAIKRDYHHMNREVMKKLQSL